MKTLVDTSVWISHFKKADKKLIVLLEADDVVVHPFILQELFLGKPKGKDFIFERLEKLFWVPMLSESEFKEFVNKNKIIGKRLGLVDTHILGSAVSHNLDLYTLDKKLAKNFSVF